MASNRNWKDNMYKLKIFITALIVVGFLLICNLAINHNADSPYSNTNVFEPGRPIINPDISADTNQPIRRRVFTNEENHDQYVSGQVINEDGIGVENVILQVFFFTFT